MYGINRTFIECLADFGHGITNVARRMELARDQRERLQAPTLLEYLRESMCSASREEARQKDGSVYSSSRRSYLYKSRLPTAQQTNEGR
jgi:hypothetical protein